MSDSDDSEPIEKSTPIRGVPIFFGKSPSVKRLMKQIKQRGLVIPDAVINAEEKVPGVVDVRDIQEDELENSTENTNLTKQEEVESSIEDTTDLTKEEEEVENSSEDVNLAKEEDMENSTEDTDLMQEEEIEHSIEDTCIKQEVIDDDDNEYDKLIDAVDYVCDGASKTRKEKNKSKRKQGSPKKTQNWLKLKAMVSDSEGDEYNAEAGPSGENTPIKKRKKKRIRKPSTPKIKTEGFKYTCEQCQMGFNGKIPLAKHYRDAHNVDKPFKCNECHKTFASIRTLNEHKVVNHTEQSANICEICGKSFSSPTYLKVHERVHTGERPFTCDQCAMSFKDNSTLRNHYKAIHTSVAANERFVCDVCGKSFHYQRYLQNHKKRLHVDGKDHQCTECGKMFRLKQTLAEHMEIHNKKDYICTQCGKHFSHYRSYRRHEKAHLITDPFYCPKCGRRYKNKKSAEPHMKTCKERELSTPSNSAEVHIEIPREAAGNSVNVMNAVEAVQRNAGFFMQFQNAFQYNV